VLRIGGVCLPRRDDVQGHGAEDAGDEFTDVAGSGGFGHHGTPGDFADCPDLGVGLLSSEALVMASR